MNTDTPDRAAKSNMPDAALHLNDVLQATEDATQVILDAAAAISGLTPDNAAINEQVGRIFEACGFQDINGQRIKKVLKRIEELESQLIRLTDSSYMASAAPPGDKLMQGPQLSRNAPTQEEVDNMFKAS